MNRRQYLRAGTALACCATSAGCLDKLDAAVGSNDDESVDNVPDRTGERALARSVGRLNEAALALDVGSDLEAGAVEFDPEGPREHITAAREFLDTAAEELGSDRRPDIDELRSYASVLETLVDVTATVTDNRLESDIDAVSAAIRDGQIEEASTTVDDLVRTFEEAEQRFGTAESNLEVLDGDRLEALSVVDLEKVESGMSALGGVLASMVALVTALESTLGGYDSLERGKNRADDGAYESAKGAFTEAESAFTASTTTLEGGRDGAPAALESYFERGLCRNEHLTDAAEDFTASAEAAMNRDRITARKRRNEAEEAVEAANEC